MSDTQLCPKCNKPMANLGNLDGITLTSNPPMHYDIYACHECKVKRPVMVKDQLPVVPDVRDYERVP